MSISDILARPDSDAGREFIRDLLALDDRLERLEQLMEQVPVTPVTVEAIVLLTQTRAVSQSLASQV